MTTSTVEEKTKNCSRKWLENTYYPTLDTAISTSYNYMHTTLNWAISIITAVVLLVMLRESFPDRLSWIILSVALILISHFAVRTGKGYLNTLRWSTIQREILLWTLDHNSSATSSEDSNLSAQTIRTYHTEWQSPISVFSVLHKLFFDLGFLYLYSIVIVVLAYVAWLVQINAKLYLVTAFCITLAILEFLQFARSPYLKRTAINSFTQKNR